MKNDKKVNKKSEQKSINIFFFIKTKRKYFVISARKKRKIYSIIKN